jgi:type 1 fimbria pilin
MKRGFVLSLVLMMTGVVFAADHHAKDVKLEGYVVDNACAEAMFKEGGKGAEGAKGHSRTCSLMPGCAKSGYSVYADGVLYKLDEESSKKVAEVLKNSKTEKGIQVKIEGTAEGDKLMVKTVSEVEASTK